MIVGSAHCLLAANTAAAKAPSQLDPSHWVSCAEIYTSALSLHSLRSLIPDTFRIRPALVFCGQRQEGLRLTLGAIYIAHGQLGG